MLQDRIEAKWIASFVRVFELCQVQASEIAVILCETQTRLVNSQLAELALQQLGVRPCIITLPTPAQTAPVPVRSTGASVALQGHPAALAALTAADFIVDLTLEGLLHAPELAAILKSGARVEMISNEHPEALERLAPNPALKDKVKLGVKKCRAARWMQVTSDAGTDLRIDLADTPAIGVWGWTERAGTISHWPGGIVVTFPKANTVNGILVLAEGDINLTFKRYLQNSVTLTIENDYVTDIEGEGTDAELMRRYFAAWEDTNAYAVSHVGWGMNPAARYEALAMYDQRDSNGTELRAFAGNFLYSTGANEYAGRYTQGHFDLPLRACTITLDEEPVVVNGILQGDLA